MENRLNYGDKTIFDFGVAFQSKIVNPKLMTALAPRDGKPED
jgi:hypothetical protein